jgi:hypothetical protein
MACHLEVLGSGVGAVTLLALSLTPWGGEPLCVGEGPADSSWQRGDYSTAGQLSTGESRTLTSLPSPVFLAVS